MEGANIVKRAVAAREEHEGHDEDGQPGADMHADIVERHARPDRDCEEASRQEVESYKHPVSSTGGSTIGELMSWKRAGNDQN